MFDGLIEIILDGLLKVFQNPRIVVVLVSILPIVEARLAIPIAIGYGLGGFESWLWAFLGSSAIVPLLLLILIPFIKWLSKTRLFKKVGVVLYEKFEKKAAGVATADEKKRDFKKMLGVFIFVAIPMPLTGVWTGSAVASITKLPYPKALLSVIAGNLVASGIITLLSVFLSAYVDWIILVISLLAVLVVIVLIIKIILHKPTPPPDTDGETPGANE